MSGAAEFLACPACEFWYPVREEIPVLLPSERVEGGMRRKLGPAEPFELPQRPAHALDLKAILYSYYMRLREAMELAQLDQEATIVDVGCSTGCLAALVPPGTTYIGLDLSFASLAFARRVTGQWFCQADAQALPLRSGRVPFVISRELLEHVDDPELAARELSRVAPRGVVIVPTREFPFLYDPVNYVLLRAAGKHVRFGAFGYDHHELFDRASWRALLERSGLIIDKQSPIGCGAWLNGFDVFYHSIWSWRQFDSLPRNGVPLPIAKALFPLFRAIHRVDSRLLKRGVSEAYLFRSRAAAA